MSTIITKKDGHIFTLLQMMDNIIVGSKGFIQQYNSDGKIEYNILDVVTLNALKQYDQYITNLINISIKHDRNNTKSN